MALPVDGQLTSTPHPAPFLPPRDRPKLRLEDWSRGGIALNDSTRSLDLYDWRFRYDEDTQTFYVGAPGFVPEVALYTTDVLAVDIAGSFDTNMQPVLGWVDDNGDAWFRWFDPVANEFTNVLLPAESYAVRVCLDDPRKSQQEGGVTDCIIAYVRESVVYYRLLRDRFEIEYKLEGSEGMIFLYQIGMNQLLRFQFSRSGVFGDDKPNLNFQRPEYRGGLRPLMFDHDGNVAFHPNSNLTYVPGKPGPNKRRTWRADLSSTYHVQQDDGTWLGITRGGRASFFQPPQTPLGERERRWTRDNEGNLQLAYDQQFSELPLDYKEVSADGKTLTGMYRAPDGNGVTFNVVSITSGPTFGSFEPNYVAHGDFQQGQAPSGVVRFADHGPFVTLSIPTQHVGLSASNRLRWPVGTIPAGARPTADRTVPCVVQQAGFTISGSALIRTDGSAEFFPLRNAASNDVLSYAFFSASGPWTAPASEVDLLLVDSGANGGAGSGGRPGGGGAAGGVRVMLGVAVTPGQTYQVQVGAAPAAPSTAHGMNTSPTWIVGLTPANAPTGGGGSPIGSGGIDGTGGTNSSGGGGSAPEGLGGAYVAGDVQGSAGGDASETAGGGGGGAGSAGTDAVGDVAGDGGDGITLSDVGFAAAADVGAPSTFAAGGGGGAAEGGTAGAGGSSGVGGAGGLVGAGGDAVPNTGSGGGGGGSAGVGGRGSGGFAVIRWASGSSSSLLVQGIFPAGGQQKGLPAGLTLTYVK